MIRTFSSEIVFARAGTSACVADADLDNVVSIRAFEKAGFSNALQAKIQPDDADFDTLLAEQGRVQDRIDRMDAWSLDDKLDHAMDALRCPEGDRDVESQPDMAAELDMTESRFSRFFRRATGNTFTDFVNHVRINRACQLLMESDRLINHIGYEVGFNNIANFNRRFLDIKGMTPSEYRKQVAKRFGLALH